MTWLVYLLFAVAGLLVGGRVVGVSGGKPRHDLHCRHRRGHRLHRWGAVDDR